MILQRLYNFLFGFRSYRRGVTIHLLIFFFYSACSVAAYFALESTVLQKDLFFYYQLRLSRWLLGCMLLHLLLVIVLRRQQSKEMARSYFSEKGPAFNLAVFRIVFFFTLAGHFAVYTFQKEISWTYLPAGSRVPLPYIGWLVNSLPITTGLYTACCILAATFSFLVCIGLFTRYAQLLLLPFAFYVLGVPLFFGKLNHHHILLWVPLLLCLSPVADAWSVDALIRKRSAEPSARYLLPFKFLWLQLAVIYFFAGVVKLWDCGLAWALSDNMVNQMRWEWVEHYDHVPAFRLDLHPALAKAAGLCVIWFELLYVLMILKPGGRIWAFATAWAFHLGTGYFMYIDFSTLRMLALSYINWDAIAARFRKRPAAPEAELSEEDKAPWRVPATRPAFYTCSALVGINFLCSALSIHSYPFSSYPTYSAMVADSIATIRMDAFDSEGNSVPVKAIARKDRFRWETFRPYELRIAHAYSTHDSAALHFKLNEYWQLWKNNVKGLDHVRSVHMYLETTPLVPEERSRILHTDSLGVVYPRP